MIHHENEQNLSPEEKLYREHMQGASDFEKIEIYKMARRYYKKALSVKPDDHEAQSKLDSIVIKQKNELKSIAFIAVVAVLIIAIVIIF